MKFKLCSAQSSLSESSLKSLNELVLKFTETRNKIQHSILSDTHENQHTKEILNESRLKQIINNFLSTEYFNLSLNLIDRSTSAKFSLSIQYESNEICLNLFTFTNQFLFNKNRMKLSDLLFESSAQFLAQYNNDVELLSASLTSSNYYVREACLNSLALLINERNTADLTNFNFNLKPNVYSDLKHALLLCCYDPEESNRKTATQIWQHSRFTTNESLCIQLSDDIIHPNENVRLASAEALANLIKIEHSSITRSILDDLLNKYEKLNEIIEPKRDQYGRVIEQAVDDWQSRTGIAIAIQNLAESLPTQDDSVFVVFKFLVTKALMDRNPTVRSKMLNASLACLNHHGRSHINDLLPLFEQFLQNAPKDASYDSVRQNVVILMGTLAKHLDKDDPKVAPIIGKLVQSLSTPSQQVQEAVANCLPALMPSIKSQVPAYVDQLITLLLTAQTYGERRGAAYGLAGMLKGVGMLSLRQLNVLQRLNEAVSNKKDAKQREGALIAYEMLTIMFNKVFEPYSVEILPNLLLCFGDADENVRNAADDCSKAIMANLTFTGVKMILPKLLERLGEEESWRTKCGSVELLGAMAHCAPKQLSTCLPSIVPHLIEVLSDSHVKVQKAGTQALKQIGSVIKNPEIQNIADVLLEALQDPAHKTSKALQVLLDTKFVHFIDAPSLALIMPVVQRAFQDRSTEIRKMAAQIMGNMYSLTDQKDLLPYLPAILPGLKASLLDPVPEVRAVSAKALGAMIKVIGENGLNEIIAWLMERLVSEVSSVDRSGAAQGLSEVFGAMGVAKLEKSMPEIIERAAQLDLSPFVRDGYIMMFIYLPLTFGDEFIPYVGQIIHPILKALADDSEFVRDTAIKAGQRIVNTYAETAISLFLPELEKGLFDINWRIRYSSVQLLGDLLYKVSGVAGKMTTESAHEDDNFGTEKGSQAIIHALGEERRNRIYSGLYMGRSDISLQVRQASLHVWKVIVSNTPRALREILPTLFNILLSCLASPYGDRRQIAATTLVDIVRKLGERILPDIIPILEHGLKSERSEQRQGVCIALSEIMANISKDNVIVFSDSLVPTVRHALLDPLLEVRQAGAKTFDNLHSTIGVKALEEVVLYLFNESRQSNENGNDDASDRALDGMKQLMLVKSRAILPFLIPYLTQPPVNINSLCKLCSCASVDVLGRHLHRILITLVQALATESNENQAGKRIKRNLQKDKNLCHLVGFFFHL
jgi:HEAT repeat protein